ncbi:hypothetical protein [Streptomyces sp. NPDC001292]|uniref:hypothetical protein n=1 Tax=Streptomyces sp. NPDC001292 TaxID=3364558 RepID=UPI0036AC1DF3
MNDEVPTDHDRRDDEWNAVPDDDFVRGAMVKEGSAPASKRVWPRSAAPAVAAFLVLRHTGSSSDEAAAPESAASAPAPSAAAAALPRHGR